MTNSFKEISKKTLMRRQSHKPQSTIKLIDRYDNCYSDDKSMQSRRRDQGNIFRQTQRSYQQYNQPRRHCNKRNKLISICYSKSKDQSRQCTGWPNDIEIGSTKHCRKYTSKYRSNNPLQWCCS